MHNDLATLRMIKLIYCFRKRPDLSDQAFDRYWRDVHGPIGARIPGVRRMVQSRTIPVPDDARGADFDGIVELWFDDVNALLAARASEEWRRSGLDEEHFLDVHSARYAVTEEREIVLPFPTSNTLP